MSIEEKDQSLDLLSKAQLTDAPMLNFVRDLTIGENGKCFICLKGDEHLGSKYHDIELHKDVIQQLLEKENTYVILMGDALETATRDSVGAGIFEQDDIVQGQMETYVELHEPLAKAGKILGMHIGNHEFRVYKHSGLNLSKTMIQLLNKVSPRPIKYLGHGIAHYFQVGSQNYTMYTTHGGSGAIKPASKVSAIMNLNSVIEADVYCMGHTHGLASMEVKYYIVDKRNKMVVERSRFYVNTGSYYSYWGGYPQMKGYAPAKKGSPIVELNSDEKNIKVWI